MDANIVYKKLPNGLTVAHVHIKDSNIFRLEMIVRGGEYQQLNDQIGYAHVVEHLLSCFTSETYPDAKDVQTKMSKMGIKSNAWTSSHVTGYWLSGLNDYFIDVLDIMIRTFTEPKIDESKFINEKEAVKKELDRIINSTWHSLSTKIKQILYNNTNLSYSTEYEKNNVENINLDLFYTMHERFYNLSNMLFIVASNHDAAYVFDTLYDYMDKSVYTDPTYYRLSVLPSNLYKENNVIFVENANVDNYKIVFTFKTEFTSFDDENYILDVLDSILTEDLNSRLYRKLREELGAVYYVSSSIALDPLYKELSVYEITTETTKDRVYDIIYAIEEVLSNITANETMEEELSQIRIKIKTSNANDELSHYPSKYSNYYSNYILWNKPIVTRHEYQELKLSVNSHDIEKLAKKLFTTDNTIIFYSGNEEL